MAADLLLRVRNDVAELGRVAAAVDLFGREHGLGQRDLFDLTLALDEVLTNVIWYAFGDGAAHEITVRLGLEGDEVVVDVCDDGRAFDPLTVPPVGSALDLPLQERPVGGLGMHLVRHAVEALAYRREMDKNVLTMRKRVSQREA